MNTHATNPAATSQPAKADSAKQAAKPSEPKAKSEQPVLATIPDASFSRRHWLVALSFVVLVILPTALTAVYMLTRAHDRYVSHIGFSVRSESMTSAMEMLGGIAEISGSSSSDTDILYNFIKSEEIIRTLDQKLDLREMWSKPGYDWLDWSDDPVFAFHPPGTIEDLTDYWSDMVRVYSDSGTGLIDVEVQAFAPEDAQAIAQAIFEESSDMINRLSTLAREDQIRYARLELETAMERLTEARQQITRFRNENQMVDPTSMIEGQVGLLTSLQQQLAQSLIEMDMLRETTRESDPRISQTERRVEVINQRIAEERGKLGMGQLNAEQQADQTEGVVSTASEAGGFANIVDEYERLAVDLQFAEQSYTAAMTSFDSARAEARRQNRYLAAHIRPSLPEAATEPGRARSIMLTAILCSLAWSLLLLVAYALRDRR
ncbi:capsule biosynthesis protein [Paracoccus aerodenitrificans]|uniref:capsule biosynthesis protein n=1 Tax=Paracoccus aerodenitrificans TaxID=3017781 RepID=UPI0022F11502|nr:capsule biosynthesis protein [Paracoccus aerodenitrificans]WBU63888.1 capsule biosynthesis protein [Paracoccus aerodenitrificans]